MSVSLALTWSDLPDQPEMPQTGTPGGETLGSLWDFLSARDLDKAWQATEARLRYLKSLRDDWDGLGASEPDSCAIETLELFLSEIRSEDPNYPPPNRIVASPDGCVIAEWQFGAGAVLEVEIEQAEEANLITRLPGQAPQHTTISLSSKSQDATWESYRPVAA